MIFYYNKKHFIFTMIGVLLLLILLPSYNYLFNKPLTGLSMWIIITPIWFVFFMLPALHYGEFLTRKGIKKHIDFFNKYKYKPIFYIALILFLVGIWVLNLIENYVTDIFY